MPAYFPGEITDGEGADKLRKIIAERAVPGKYAELDEITSALLFLVSPASFYMTGASLIVAGRYPAASESRHIHTRPGDHPE